jgi:hypothetical protein
LLVPERPAHIDALPSELADRATRFDGRFADRIELQPAEHWECWGHAGVWLDLDRRTVRPLPDTDDFWPERVAEMQQRFPNLVFIPAPTLDDD